MIALYHHDLCAWLRLQAENCLLKDGKCALGGQPAWDPAAVKAFIGVSGAYDVDALAEHLDRRGLNRSMFSRIMSVHGKAALKALSPLYAFKNGHPGIWCAQVKLGTGLSERQGYVGF